MIKISRILMVLSVLLLNGCVQEPPAHLDIFYTADVQGFYHSRLEPRFSNQPAGGYGVLKNFLAARTEPYLFFDGGNWFGVAPEAAMTQGSFVVPFLKALPCSAASVSEQDFAYGWPVLRTIVRDLSYPVLVSNLKLDNQIPWPLHDYHIFTRGTLKIGVFGLVSPNVVQTNRNRLTGFTVEDPVEAARRMVALLQQKGVDFIILLSSLGDNTPDTPADALLAEEVNGIHLILSANKDREMPETDRINQTYLVYPGSKLDSVAHIRLEFDKNNQIRDLSFEDIALLRHNWGEDPELATVSLRMQQDTQHKLNARISTVPERISTSLVRESPLGDLLATCLHRWSRLDGAILNADSIRSALPEGTITEYDVYKMYPYGDNITFLTIKGAAFIKALEASLEAKDNFPQIAGFSVEYNPEAPAGERIRKITLSKGRVLRPQDTYRFAVTDHVLAGGFGHDYFIDSLEFKNTFVDARQIMRACLIRQKKIIPPLRTERWKIVP